MKIINRKKLRIRKKLRAVSNRPRITVFKSLKYISVQVIDDNHSQTICASHEKKISGKTKSERMTNLGQDIAEKMKAAKINQAYFDRGEYKYHGHIARVVAAIRASGIKI